MPIYIMQVYFATIWLHKQMSQMDTICNQNVWKTQRAAYVQVPEDYC